VVRAGLVLVALFALCNVAAAQDPDAGVGPSDAGGVDTATDASTSPEPDSEEVANEARELFRRGVALSRQERWGEALEYFRRSRALVERPSTTFNIALALLRLGRPTEGRATLQEYIAQSEGNPREAARRQQAGELLSLAMSTIAELTLALSPIDAEVRVDGVLREGAGETRVISLDPGSHSLRVTHDGYIAETLDLSVLDGERVSREIALAERNDPAEVRVTASVANAIIVVDGAEVGTGRWSGSLAPGRHTIEVRAEDHEPFRQEIEVEAMERRDVTASLSRIEGSLWSNPWLWVAVGVVVVGAGVGVGVGVASSGTADPYGGTTGVVLQGLTGP
jgi:hypothetical protein